MVTLGKMGWSTIMHGRVFLATDSISLSKTIGVRDAVVDLTYTLAHR